MFGVIATGALLANFVTYPALGDRGVVVPRKIETAPRVEMTTDLGPIVEIVVRCRRGTAIISYSKVERLFCSPKHKCERALAPIIARSCG